MILNNFESQECAIKMGVQSLTADTMRILADKVKIVKAEVKNYRPRDDGTLRSV